jgi:hypothetical protein
MTRILGSSRSAIVASHRVRRPGNDGRGRRPPRSSCHHLRDERRKLPPPRRTRTQARPRPPADPCDNHGQRLIAALRHPKTSIPLARQSRHDNHANAATPDSYPDCRSFPIQIAALHPGSRHRAPNADDPPSNRTNRVTQTARNLAPLLPVPAKSITSLAAFREAPQRSRDSSRTTI